MDYLGGAHVITGVFKSKDLSSLWSEGEMTAWEGFNALSLVLECRELRARPGEWPPDAGKGKETSSPLGPPERSTARPMSSH